MVQPRTYKYAAAEGSKGTSCAQPEVGPKEMAYMEDGKAALAELSVCVLGSLPLISECPVLGEVPHRRTRGAVSGYRHQ